MMMVWWAAFFVLGMAFPPTLETQCLASIVLLGASLGVWAWPDTTIGKRRSPPRFSAGKGASYCVLTCAASIILWGAAGMERAAHEAVPDRSWGASVATSARGSAASGNFTPESGRVESGIRSLSLWDQRERLLELLDDGRLSKRGRGIVGALVLDDRSGLDWRLSETYSYLGITHFLALSGMHLGVIAVPLSWILSRVVRSKRLRDLLLFVVLCLYSAVAGLPPSLMRSLALCAAVLAYGHFSVHSDLLNALIGGSLALVAADSSVVFDAGFQLSFAAVAAIALLGVPLSTRIESVFPEGARGALLKTLLFPAVITCSVQFVSLPLVIALFRRSSLLSPIVNVLVSFPFTVLLYGAVLYVFVPLGPLRTLLSYPVNAVCRLLDDVPSFFSRSPHAALYRGDFDTSVYVIGAVFVAWGMRRSCERRGRALAAGAICVVLSFLAPQLWRAASAAFPAGEAPLAAPLLSRVGSVYVSDGPGIVFIGERFGERQSYRMTRELWGLGKRRVAYCVVMPSRLRKNNGLLYLLARISVGEVVVSPYLLRAEPELEARLAADGIVVRALSAGGSIDTGLAHVEITGPIYPPAFGLPLGRNEAALRCRLVVGGKGAGEKPSFAGFVDPDALRER